jgi:uncharacterized protein VirK/YbjX
LQGVHQAEKQLDPIAAHVPENTHKCFGLRPDNFILISSSTHTMALRVQCVGAEQFLA